MAVISINWHRTIRKLIRMCSNFGHWKTTLNGSSSWRTHNRSLFKLLSQTSL